MKCPACGNGNQENTQFCRGCGTNLNSGEVTVRPRLPVVGSSAQVPGLILFQAVLTDFTGALVEDGDYTVTFAFCSSATGGTSLWSETQVVTTADGPFTTQLGSANPITPSTVAIDDVWLGLTVGSDEEMTRRQWMVSTISAHVASNF